MAANFYLAKKFFGPLNPPVEGMTPLVSCSPKLSLSSTSASDSSFYVLDWKDSDFSSPGNDIDLITFLFSILNF